jgi:hypothetical protein
MTAELVGAVKLARRGRGRPRHTWDHRPGRRSYMQLLRQHYDAEWELLPVRELREYERVLVVDFGGSYE